MSRVILNFRSGFAGLREGFEAIGHEVVENQWAPEGAALAGTALCVADFVDCARKIRRTLGLKARLARAKVPFIGLNRDAPFNRGVHPARLALMAWLKPIDVYASHSMQSAGRYSARTLYCPNAAREAVYRVEAAQLAAMRDPGWYRWDVSFLGNLDAVRYGEHARRVAFLKALETKLASLDIRVLFRDSAGMPEAEQLEVIRASRINLSTIAACDAGSEPSWGLPERCYGVPACGGFLLSDKRQHAVDDFADDERAEYGSQEDCVAKIRHYLARFDEARAIAERAHARVARDHGYRNRATLLLDFARHVR
jgi:spore maturation protein CgeB